MKEFLIAVLSFVFWPCLCELCSVHGEDGPQGPIACLVCIDIQYKTCNGTFGAFPGTFTQALNCSSTQCASSFLGGSPTEILYSCNRLASNEYTLLTPDDWLHTIIQSAQFPVYPATGSVGRPTMNSICKIDQTCNGCEYSEENQFMACNILELVYSIPVYVYCENGDYDLISCDNDPH